MTAAALLESLSAYHGETLALAEQHTDAELRGQYNPLLSPLGWHVGHCSFIETLWVQGELLGQHGEADRWQALYQPEMAYKPGRGAQLPERSALMDWCRHRHTENRAILADPPRRLLEHPLLQEDYLALFLIQHYAQHLETMDYVRAQHHRRSDARVAPGQTVPPAGAQTVTLPQGRYAIGSDEVGAYDNERRPHEVDLPRVRLGCRPVSSGEFLAFIKDGGYQRPELWDAEGRAWLSEQGAAGPDFWAQDASGARWRLTPSGWAPWRSGEPATGLSHFEAAAYACWAGARLPHEYEWEAAARLGLLGGIGWVWEWCSNPFHAYPGFRAFPYEGYSLPWFDGRHFVMRGASRSTRPAVRRPSFRNFFTRDVRHVFAGLRLAYD